MRVGRYDVLERLGAGAMGEVWRAVDADLGREVAVKFLKAQSDKSLARFHREATLAGRLNHPNIAAIYDVGEAAGRHFIVMELVRGRSLAGAVMTPREAAEAVRDAARAVHHANGLGIVHRDLKPSNLMREDGGRIRVMDFGLAREVEHGSTLTSTGVLVGTPVYMAPEQARGETVDARTDVYGLGATLFELLVGQPPFSGSTVFDVAMAVVEEDPPRPAKVRPEVDGALEVVVLKCLEKDPERRYADAAALADDLERWLAGSPVVATPPVPRAPRRKARRGLVVAAAAAGLAAALLALLVYASTRVSKAEETVLGEMRRTSEICLDAAMALRRAGDLDGMRTQARALEVACRRVIEAHPALAEPHYRLGRIYRAQFRFAEAKAEQERALAKEPAFAPARYERALLTAAEWRRLALRLQARARQDEGLRLAREGGGEVRAGRQPGTSASPRELALATDQGRALLVTVRGDAGALAGLAEPERLCAAGVLAGLERRVDEARDALRRSGLDDAIEALGQVEREAGALDAAIAAWSELLARDRGNVSVLLARGEAFLTRGAFDEAQRDFAEAARLLPSAETLILSGRVRAERARLEEDPTPRFAEAARDLDDAVRREPGNDDAWAARAAVRAGWAGALARRGEDPTPMLDEALRDAGEAIRLNGAESRHWMWRGGMHLGRAVQAVTRGRDPRADLEAASADFGRALQLDAKVARSWLGRGSARVMMGRVAMAAGGDPEPHFVAGISDFAEAARFEAERAAALRHLGRAHGDVALWAMSRGRDADPHFADAIRAFDRAIDRDASSAEAFRERGGALSNWANHRERTGRPESGLVERALRDLDQAVRLDPADPDARRWRANTRVNAALTTRDRTQSLELFEGAIDDVDGLVKLGEASAAAWETRASVYFNLSGWLSGSGMDPEAAYQEAIGAYTRALALNPAQLNAYVMRGQMRVNWAVHLRGRGLVRPALLDEALADLDRAVAINPRDAEARKVRGHVRFERGRQREALKEDPSAEFRTALEDYTEAVRLNPSLRASVAPHVEYARRYRR